MYIKPSRLSFFLVLYFLICSWSTISAQNPIPEGLFRPPLDIPLSLSGTFCELRTNHFHSGLDFRTEGRQGVPVYAAASGYVVRIKVSAGGFGKVIYINHPEGFTTVYAHLSGFNPELQAIIDSAQFANHSFETEMFPDSCRFKFSKGDFLGWSGNSGSSEAPHLHFEIRDQQSEEPLNPMFAGFLIQDTIKPEIKEVNFFAYNNNYWSYESKSDVQFSDSVSLKIFGDTVGLGFLSVDRDLNNQLGIYAARVYADDSLIFQYSFQRMNFSESRLVNAHIYYPAKKRFNQSVERCFVLPGDSGMIFKNAGRGWIILKDTIPVKLILEVQDFAGNTSVKYITIQKNTSESIAIEDGMKVEFNKGILIIEDQYTVKIPPAALYMDAFLKSSIVAEVGPGLSPVLQIGNEEIPLQKPFSVTFNSLKIPAHLETKLLLAELDAKFNIKSVSNATIKGGKVEGNSRNFGLFTIIADTTAPDLLKSILMKDPVDSIPYYALYVKDDLSGIKTYSVEMNGQWVLAEWDPRIQLLSLPSTRNKNGPDQLRIMLGDFCGNVNILSWGF
ncbi:M23 family metallopeptidase [soil metagenome]